MPIRSYRALADESIDIWVVGSGLGGANADEILEFFERTRQPMVVDADA